MSSLASNESLSNGFVPRVCAVVPVKDLRGTKSRLAPILDPCARAGLTLYMMCRVVRRLMETGVEHICVVSPDRVVLEEARDLGASALLQRSRGLNPALEEGRDFALETGASSLLVIPADLPLVEVSDLRALLAPSESHVVISPDGTGTGTNSLLFSPPDTMPFLFGPGSFDKHLSAARERGLAVDVRRLAHLAFDLDTAEDFARLDSSDALGAALGDAVKSASGYGGCA